MRWAHRLTLSSAAIAVSAAVAAQQGTVPTFRSGRELLTITAAVRDAAGRPLTDLTPQEFTVRIDGTTRPVVSAQVFGSAEAVSVAPRGTSTANAPAVAAPHFASNVASAPGRIVIVALDRLSIRGGGERAAIESAVRLVESLPPTDAVAAIGIPGAVTDLTRDHATVVEAIRHMSGTAAAIPMSLPLSWEAALEYEQTCDRIGATDPACGEVDAHAVKEMLMNGRAQATTTLSNLEGVLQQLEPVRGPKSIVLISGGIPFDTTLLGRYRALTLRAARSHATLFVMHLDQPTMEAADRGPGTVRTGRWSAGTVTPFFGGRDYTAGLGNIAADTGGVFFSAVGGARGVFDRIASDLASFYEIGIESIPSDADGKPHRIEVTVARPGARVRAPSATAAAVAAAHDPAASLARALAQPTDVLDVPLDVATYVTHSRDPDKVHLLMAVEVPAVAAVTPVAWAFAVMDGSHVVASSRTDVADGGAAPWSTTAGIDLAPGSYRLRTAVVAADGRVGTFDVPLRAGLRAAGDVHASDLVVGTLERGLVRPRGHVRRDEAVAGTIELSSAGPLDATAATLQLVANGATQAVLRVPLVMRTRADDKTLVTADARLELSQVVPGTYTASAIIERDGAAIGRVSRVIEVAAASPAKTIPSASPVAAVAPSADPRESDASELLARVGAYVAAYVEKAAVMIAVEHYEQASFDGSVTGTSPGGSRSTPSKFSAPEAAPHAVQRRLVSEMALVPNPAAIGGWLAFRDVIEVNGKALPERRDRLQTLFQSGDADLDAARRLTAESARYNLGPVVRTFNVPTWALFFFHPVNLPRFTFHRTGTERVGGVACEKVAFVETHRPTMIMTARGGDVASSGILWIDPADGSVRRTELVLGNYRGERSRAEIDVTYRLDPSMGLLVPDRMTEVYLTRSTTVTGEATYGNFRRFETTTRIK